MSLRIRVASAALLAAACSTGADQTATTDSGAVATTSLAATTTTSPVTALPATTTTRWTGPPLYQYIGTASQDPDADAMLCFGFYDLMAPPHCDGFPVLGLDWDEVAGARVSSGTTWATVRLVGTFDGTAFTVTQPRPEAAGRDGHHEPVSFDLPCPTPADGWRATDPSTATGWDRVQAKFYAEAQPEFAGMWLSYPDSPSELVGPPNHVVVVGFTDDIAEHREHLESIYGGPLCVAQRDRTLTELNRIAGELFTLLGSAEAREHGIWVSPKGAVVSTRTFTSPPLEAIVFAITSPGTDDWVAEHLGEGTVSLWSVLTPVGSG